jgi:hypothetical protein
MKRALIGCVIICLSIDLSQAQRIPPLNPNRLGIGPTNVWRCYPLRYDSKIGVGYGIQTNSFGIKIHKYRAWMLGIPLMLITEMDWRIRNQKNSYLNLDFIRDDIASLGKFSIASNVGYKRLSSGNMIVNNQLYAGLGLFKKHYGLYGLTLAYARQHQQLPENFSLNDDGIMMRYYHEFFDQFEVQVSAIYWFDQFQYAIQLNENIFESRFTIGVGYEKIGMWDEVGVSVMYQYH